VAAILPARNIFQEYQMNESLNQGFSIFLLAALAAQIGLAAPRSAQASNYQSGGTYRSGTCQSGGTYVSGTTTRAGSTYRSRTCQSGGTYVSGTTTRAGSNYRSGTCQSSGTYRSGNGGGAGGGGHYHPTSYAAVDLRRFHPSPKSETNWQHQPKVQLAALGVGLGTASGAAVGGPWREPARQSIASGAVTGSSGTSDGIGLIGSSRTTNRHATMQDTVTGSSAGGTQRLR